jgi:2-dehydro-3-deoxygluconokinase
MDTPSVVTMGECMVLFWPASDASLEEASSYERSFGGAEGNFAIALARLGVDVRWISRLGDDAFGRYIRRSLEAEGVEVTAGTDREAPTAVFFKERVRTGPRRVVYYRKGSAAGRLSPADLAPALFRGARLLHVTGITPALSESCSAAVTAAVLHARSEGCLISVDPNVRPQLWSSLDRCRTQLRALIATADLVLLGDEDAAVLFPEYTEEDLPRALHALGPRTVVLKLGARGACAVSGDDEARVPVYPVEVVDTVGAGDGFDGGFIAGLLRGLPLVRCLQLGARVGAAAVAVAGDWEGYPRRGDVSALLEEHDGNQAHTPGTDSGRSPGGDHSFA